MTSTDDRDGRSKLIDAARTELGERGVDSLSLRSIARRAGLSNAAPGYFFGDLAGMLTAVAVDGYRGLADALRASAAPDGTMSLSGLGRAYVDFGLRNPELFTLMFRPAFLRPDDPDLRAASGVAIGILSSAIVGPDDPAVDGRPPRVALVSWAFAHGLVALAREGALQNVAADTDAHHLIGELIDVFDTRVSHA